MINKIERAADIFIAIIIAVIITIIVIIPVSCHQNIKRTQRIAKQTGVEMTYWDIFWISPDVVIANGKVEIKK